MDHYSFEGDGRVDDKYPKNSRTAGTAKKKTKQNSRARVVTGKKNRTNTFYRHCFDV